MSSPVEFYSSDLEGCTDEVMEATSYINFTNLEIGFLSGLAVVSILTSATIATTIFYSKKLSMHPSKLIGYMCISEAIQSFQALIWLISPYKYACYFGWHYLLSWLTG